MSESKMPRTKNADLPDLQFQVRGLPIAKPRQSRRDKFEPSRAVQAYRAWADLVRLAARHACNGLGGPSVYLGPVALSARFILPIPASWSKGKQAAIAVGPGFHTAKPDLDNLIKGIKDPLNGVVWVDDSQVVGYREPLWKQYGTVSIVGAYVKIWFLEG